MKKLLALVLALVMTMSLVTISNAADFTDADSIDYKEAVAVMKAVGVIDGYTDGSFGAKDTLTRAQAAKIIAYLDMGKDVADALIGTGKVFSDVKANNWAAGYIEYLAQANIVSGIGDGKFAPDEKVTGLQFAKMLLVVLGYDQKVEELTGASWEINVAKLAASNDLFKDMTGKTNVALTREQAAQVAFNALKATTVEYDTKGTNITIGDANIAVGASKAVAVKANTTGTETNNYTGDGDGKVGYGTVQLLEKLYDRQLKLEAGEADDFGRPGARKWTYKSDKVYNVVKTALFTYTAETSAKNMLKDLKGWYKDSKTTANKITEESDIATLAGLTKNGKLVEIYGDKDNKIIDTTPVTVTYQVTTIDDITTNKAGDVTYSFNYSGSVTAKDFADDDKNTDTVKVYGKVAEDDIVTVAKTTTPSTVYHIYPTTKVVGTQTQKTNDKITVSGTAYSVALGVNDNTGTALNMSLFANKTSDNNYYLDQYGFVVKTSAIAEEKNYAVIDLIALMGASGTASNKYAEAKLVFADGTTKTVKVTKIGDNKVKDFGTSTPTTSTEANLSTDKENNGAFVNKVVTYTVKNDEYTLKFVGSDPADLKPTSGVPTLGTYSVNSDTVVVVKTVSGTSTKFTAYTGYKAMPTITTAGAATVATTVATDDGKVVFVYVDAEGATVSGAVTKTDVFYAISDDVTVTGSSADSNLVYAVEGILNGEKTTIKSEEVIFDVTGNVQMAKGEMYTVEFDGNGYVTKSTLQGAVGDDFVKSTVTTAKSGLLVTNVKTYTYDGTEKVVVIDSDGELVSGSITSASKDDVVYIKVVDKTAADGSAKNIAIDTIYIIQK